MTTKNNEQTLISIPDLAQRWGTDKSGLWNKVQSGDIPANRLGIRWFIPMDFVKEFE